VGQLTDHIELDILPDFFSGWGGCPGLWLGSDGERIGPGPEDLSSKQHAPGSRIYGAAILMLETLKDLWGFMRQNRKFWLAPFVAVLLLLGVLVILAEYSAVAPFVYTLF
jgi:Family of unknown function (DUF5989)